MTSSHSDTIDLSEYLKLKKIGIPSAAIRNRMLNGGIDTTLINKFLQTHETYDTHDENKPLTICSNNQASLLIDGFIHEMQKILHQHVIAYDINKICFKFYHIKVVSFDIGDVVIIKQNINTHAPAIVRFIGYTKLSTPQSFTEQKLFVGIEYLRKKTKSRKYRKFLIHNDGQIDNDKPLFTCSRKGFGDLIESTAVSKTIFTADMEKMCLNTETFDKTLFTKACRAHKLSCIKHLLKHNKQGIKSCADAFCYIATNGYCEILTYIFDYYKSKNELNVNNDKESIFYNYAICNTIIKNQIKGIIELCIEYDNWLYHISQKLIRVLCMTRIITRPSKKRRKRKIISRDNYQQVMFNHNILRRFIKKNPRYFINKVLKELINNQHVAFVNEIFKKYHTQIQFEQFKSNLIQKMFEFFNLNNMIDGKKIKMLIENIEYLVYCGTVNFDAIVDGKTIQEYNSDNIPIHEFPATINLACIFGSNWPWDFKQALYGSYFIFILWKLVNDRGTRNFQQYFVGSLKLLFKLFLKTHGVLDDKKHVVVERKLSYPPKFEVYSLVDVCKCNKNRYEKCKNTLLNEIKIYQNELYDMIRDSVNLPNIVIKIIVWFVCENADNVNNMFLKC
eukprot:248045_1